MSKIIWFLIHPENINIPLNDIDVFDAWLNFVSFEKLWYKLIFWWIWDIEELKSADKISFRKNQDLTLEDRNIVVDFSWNEIIIENDWLWSIPVFYNKQHRIISTLSLKTIYGKNYEYDYNAISNYFKAWYCLYGNTLIKWINFLRFYSKITLKGKEFNVLEKIDDCLDILNNNKWKIVSEDILNKIKNYVNSIINEQKNIVIPTSWWFDSRLLNNMVDDKKKIKSFSYWISKDPYKSFETVYAKKLSEKLKTDFKVIELNEYYDEKYLKSFFKLFWISTHLHWMYHIEFYKKIFSSIDKKESLVLSGIVWDVWAWKVEIWPIKSTDDIKELYYSHGLCIEENIISKNTDNKYCEEFFNKYYDQLENEEMRIIYLIRTKLILLSYLMIIPEYLWVITETPFLNKEVSLDILSLPSEERKWRNWQKKYFKSEWIYFEETNIKTDISNSLDQITLSETKNELTLKNIPKFIDQKFIEKTNINLKDRSIENKLFNTLKSIFWEKLTVYLKFWLNKFFWIRWLFNKNLDSLYNYLILKVFQYAEERWKWNNN